MRAMCSVMGCGAGLPGHLEFWLNLYVLIYPEDTLRTAAKNVKVMEYIIEKIKRRERERKQSKEWGK